MRLLQFDSEIVGKHAHFGYLRDRIERYGFTIGGNWDFDSGSFDNKIWKDNVDTIYLRIPFVVTEGELDAYNTVIKFEKPYIIKHIANIGLDYDEGSLLDTSGFSQFQTPVDKDSPIREKNKWIQLCERLVSEKVIPNIFH